jgi:hypothetical protein
MITPRLRRGMLLLTSTAWWCSFTQLILIALWSLVAVRCSVQHNACSVQPGLAIRKTILSQLPGLHACCFYAMAPAIWTLRTVGASAQAHSFTSALGHFIWQQHGVDLLDEPLHNSSMHESLA